MDLHLMCPLCAENVEITPGWKFFTDIRIRSYFYGLYISDRQILTSLCSFTAMTKVVLTIHQDETPLRQVTCHKIAFLLESTCSNTVSSVKCMQTFSFSLHILLGVWRHGDWVAFLGHVWIILVYFFFHTFTIHTFD